MNRLEPAQIEDPSKTGYVLKVSDKIAGYMCIDFSGEPAYTDIKGR